MQGTQLHTDQRKKMNPGESELQQEVIDSYTRAQCQLK